MFDTTHRLFEWFVALTAAIAASFGWYKWGKKRVNKHVRRTQMIEDIYLTLKPNGGSSLVDRVADIHVTTKRMDKTLALSETGRRTMISVMEIGEWHSDSSGKCVYINAAACRICNRPEADFLGRNWYNVIHADDAEWVASEWDRAVRELRTFRLSYRWTKSDGTAVPVRVVASTVLDSGGGLIGWVAIVRPEIT